MSIDTLKNAIPDTAKDIRLNLSSLANEEILNPQQQWGCFLACALAGGNATVIREIEQEAADNLSAEAYDAVKAAASIMAMNNVYYKFAGMMGQDYQSLPAKLRMNVIGNPGVDKLDFELWSLAVSAINGCQYCVISHEKMLRDGGMTTEQVQAAVRIAAVVQAASAILEAEEALTQPQAMAA